MKTLEKAIAVAGSQSKLARLLGVSPQSVNKWKCIPVARALDVERVTKGQVTALAVLKEAQSTRA